MSAADANSQPTDMAISRDVQVDYTQDEQSRPEDHHRRREADKELLKARHLDLAEGLRAQQAHGEQTALAGFEVERGGTSLFVGLAAPLLGIGAGTILGPVLISAGRRTLWSKGLLTFS